MRIVFYFPKKNYFCVCNTGLAFATKIFFQDILMMSPGGTSSSAVFQMFLAFLNHALSLAMRSDSKLKNIILSGTALPSLQEVEVGFCNL